MKYFWVVLVAGLTVSACGGQSESGPTEVQPTTTTATVPDVNTPYYSVHDIRSAVAEGGFVCSDWEVHVDDEFATETASCAGVLVFGIYENAALIAEHRKSRNDLTTSRSDMAYDLVGPNWTVTCEDRQDLCEALLPLLGGEIVVSDLTEE